MALLGLQRPQKAHKVSKFFLYRVHVVGLFRNFAENLMQCGV